MKYAKEYINNVEPNNKTKFDYFVEVLSKYKDVMAINYFIISFIM